jgi:hypothetical protein
MLGGASQGLWLQLRLKTGFFTSPIVSDSVSLAVRIAMRAGVSSAKFNWPTGASRLLANSNLRRFRN